MKHYKHPNSGEVFAYDTAEERERFGAAELVAMTAAEVKAHLNPPASPADLAAELAAFRGLREGYLNRLTGIGLAAQLEGDADTLAAAVAMRRGLLDMTDAPAVVAASTREEIQTALKSGYAALVSAVPAKLRNEFKKVGA